MNRTVFMVFVLPFLLGAIVRVPVLRWEKGYLLSVVFLLLSAVIWIYTEYLVHHGVDGTVLLWAVMATEFAVGYFLVGVLTRLMKK